MLMSATTFTTQRQLMMKNMPARAGQPVRQAAEDAALPDAALLRDLRHELPDRCADLLADHQPVVDGTAVLRDPPYAGAGLPAEKALEERRKRQGAQEVHRPWAAPRGAGRGRAGHGRGAAPSRRASASSPSARSATSVRPNGPKPATKPVPSRARRPPPSARPPVGTRRPQAGTPEPAARTAVPCRGDASLPAGRRRTTPATSCRPRVRHPASQETHMTDQDPRGAGQPDEACLPGLRPGGPAAGRPAGRRTSHGRIRDEDPATTPTARRTTPTPVRRRRPRPTGFTTAGGSRRRRRDRAAPRRRGRATSSARARSPRTSSRSCSTSPTWTATSTSTSTATARRSPSSTPTRAGCRAAWSARTARCSTLCRS